MPDIIQKQNKGEAVG